MVRAKGLEPPRLASLEPKSSASTNSATPASALAAHTRPLAHRPVGATVSTPPKQIAITFSESVEPAFSSIEVTDAAGNRDDTGKPQVAADDRQVLIVALQPLGPGAYKVVWHAVSVDTHKTQGSYSFTVAP